MPWDMFQHYSYDPVGNRISETDANGNVTTYSYDPLNRLVDITDALGNVSIYSYDPVGNRISETDANGNITTYSYDPLNRLVDITDALGYVSNYSYDPVGNRISETDANGNVTTYSYDPLNRLVDITDALGYVSNYSYDPVGNRISLTDAKGNVTTYSYDPLNRLISETDAMGYICTYSYDPVGNRITITDANGNTTTYSYDSLNRLVNMTDAMGYISTYSYDPVGNRISETDANGNTISYTYDGLNRLTLTTSPMGNQTAISYDGESNVIGRTDPNGNNTTYSYDALNRLINELYPVGSTLRIYDPVGNILQLSNSGIGLGDITDRIYDAVNRLISETINYGSFTKTISYTYDPVGNIIGVVDPDGMPINYSYDAVNQVIDATDPFSGVTDITYDPSGNSVQTDLPNNEWNSSTYDNLDRLTDKTTKDPVNNTLFDYDYTYNGIGQIQDVYKDGLVEAQYNYSANNWITGAVYPSTFQSIQYTYDAVGNRLTQDDYGNITSYTYNLEDRVTSQTFPDMSTINYTYDNNGNVIQTSSSWGTVLNSFDFENRLTNISYPAPYGYITNYFSPEGIRLARDERGQMTYYFPTLIGNIVEMDNSGATMTRLNPGISMAQDVPKDNGSKATEITYIHWDGEFGSTNFTGFNIVSCDFDYFGGILNMTGFIDEVDPGLFATGKKVDWDPMIGAELIGIDYAPDIDQRYGNTSFLPSDFFGPGSEPFNCSLPDEFFGPGSDPFDCPIPAGFFGPGSDPFDPPPAIGPFKPWFPPVPIDKPPEPEITWSDGDDWDNDYDPYMPQPPSWSPGGWIPLPPIPGDGYIPGNDVSEPPGQIGGMIVDDPSLHPGHPDYDPRFMSPEPAAKKNGKCPYKEEGKWKKATKEPIYRTQETPDPKGGKTSANCPKCGERTTKQKFEVTYRKKIRKERKISYCTLEAGHKYHHELKSKTESKWFDRKGSRTKYKTVEFRYGCGHKKEIRRRYIK